MLRKQTIHPYILLTYFISMLVWIVLYKHPISILLFSISLFIVYGYLCKIDKQSILSYGILILIIIITNPLFVREGADILYQNDYIIITKQALVYGAVFGLVITCVLLLYQIMQKFMTSEHILFAFSKHFKILGLILMLVFRMLPKCKRKIKEIRDVQNALHQQKKGLWLLLKTLKDQFLVLFTWIFETSLIMYESMKARGYQNHRTHYHIFRWTTMDTYYIIIIIVLNIGMALGYYQYQDFYYYPIMAPIVIGGKDIIFWIVGIVFCLLPLTWKGEEYVESR
ncbi:MAG: energy-coupling factor transporter transmembrane component T [Coprobacillaceae bacterium]